MNSSNGNFLDENGNVVNLVELLRTGKATPVVNRNNGNRMNAHSGWFTDENGTPVNIIALIDAAIDEDEEDESDEPAIGGISVNGGNVVTPDENGIINLTISGDGSTVIDSELSASSTNPVQNKVVTGEIADLNDAVDSLNGSLDNLKKVIPVIDNTYHKEYESAPEETEKIANRYNFVAGKKYKATLKINSASFNSGTDIIRIQQSLNSGYSTSYLSGYVFRINNSGGTEIADGMVFESEFVAVEGCVNLLARYKLSAGITDVELLVTEDKYISEEVEEIKKEITSNYDDSIVKSRMQMGAHRGAEHFAPPNCVAAYEIAGKMGFPWAWLAQIRWSASGTLYVMHDADVSITTNGTGNIQDLTDEYINSLLCNKITSYDYSQFTDDDLRIPTLEKAIQICLRYGMKMCFRIEPFPNQITTELHQIIWDNFETLIKAYGISADWCCYSGYNVAEMVKCITLFGEDAELCPYLGTVSAQDVVDWFNNITSVTVKNKSILLNASNLTLADVKLLHMNGIKVYAFTNSTTPQKETVRQAAYWGVDIFQNPTYARVPMD